VNIGTTENHQDGEKAGRFGVQTPKPGSWTRRSNSRDRHGIPEPHDRVISNWPPDWKFLFLGPTGSGKTRIVEATAQSLLSEARAMIKIDWAEYQHSHEVAKLGGSPPGYLGHRETHPLLSQDELNRHHTDKIKLSLVLFDEIEKASDALWNLLAEPFLQGEERCRHLN
jgi:ATP-dependent Clp protease ATP-binding subunit ClpA